MADKKPKVFAASQRPAPEQYVPQQPVQPQQEAPQQPVQPPTYQPPVPQQPPTYQQPAHPPTYPQPSETIGNPQVSSGEMAAAQEMLRRTQEQLAARAAAAQTKSMEEEIQIPVAAIPTYASMLADPMTPISSLQNQPSPVAPVEKVEDDYSALSEPKWDAPFDLIPLPSKGKPYKGVKESVKVAYMSGSDENILTSANLLESGEFLRVLISRNLLEKNLTYDDLTLGDRNAIMLWLRGSSFGNMYPVTVIDSNGIAEEHDFDLNELKYIYLVDDPDENGCFDFTCPQGGNKLKYRFLTVRDEDLIEKKLKDDEDSGSQLNSRSTYTLQQQLVSVDGDSNPVVVKRFAENMRLGDIKAFRKHYESKESGVDLNITIRTVGGESVSTFLPFNINFFWAN